MSYTRRTQSLTNHTFKIWYSTDGKLWLQDSKAVQIAKPPVKDIEVVDVLLDKTLRNKHKLTVRVQAVNPVLDNEMPAPELKTFWGNGDTVTLNFSQPLIESIATNTSNFSLENKKGKAIAISAATLSSDGKTIILKLRSKLSAVTQYQFAANNLFNKDGVSMKETAAGQFKTWDNSPNGIKVFILAGQSNMVGKGHSEPRKNSPERTIGTLRHLAMHDSKHTQYNYTSLLTDPSKPSTSDWATRNDVKVWWRRGYVNNPRNVKKGDLGVGFGNHGEWIGPEYAFGQILGDSYKEPVLIIKCAWGGIDLAGGFRPPSAAAARGGSTGDYYKSIIHDVQQALGNIENDFPDLPSKKGYQIVGFGWHQGYNDMVGGKTVRAEYEQNLADFINDIRSAFSRPNLPFSIATTSMFPPKDGRPSNPVELAQLAVADPSKHPEFHKPSSVATVWAGPFWRDPANSPATAGQAFHWNHNAESYFLIGKGIADNMKKLLGL